MISKHYMRDLLKMEMGACDKLNIDQRITWGNYFE